MIWRNYPNLMLHVGTWRTSKTATRERYAAVPISDMLGFQQKFHEVQVPSNEVLKQIRHIFLNELQDSSLSLHRRHFKNNDLMILIHNCCQSTIMMELYNYKVELKDCCEETLSHYNR
ncbi:hypothetical protein QE152_g29897 [Popillia japonica]|uniref:Uncharacterized protein n=1 Tax=Popillia japonica TaxID=7064 RepID=A0AAW1JGN4_POPJA